MDDSPITSHPFFLAPAEAKYATTIPSGISGIASQTLVMFFRIMMKCGFKMFLMELRTEFGRILTQPIEGCHIILIFITLPYWYDNYKMTLQIYLFGEKVYCITFITRKDKVNQNLNIIIII